MTKQEREMHWRVLLEQQAGSGLSVRAWCAREAVSYAELNRRANAAFVISSP